MSRIATNVSALNTWRNLTITNQGLTKSLERLSSGYRINRAADDAAGLAISEKMRGQIAGLNMAIKNAQDGVSLIQTGEGALNEVHAMLKRMEELAVQAANDTNTPEDRAKLQSEMDQLAQEVARIGSTTEFNTLKLLDGTFEAKDIVFHIGANEDQQLRIRISDMRSHALNLAGDARLAPETVAISVGVNGVQDLLDGSYTVRDAGAGTYEMVNDAGTVVGTSADGLVWTGAGAVDDTWTFTQAVTSGTATVSGANITGTPSFTNGGLEAGVYTVSGSAGSTQILDQYGKVVATWDGTANYVDIAGTVIFTPTVELAAGASVTVGGVDISGQQAANSALPTVRGALEKVSAQRALFGATQNRLEHTINNLTVTAENLAAAESRIRDTDMALEMSNFTKHQILLQAGTAMLAQANAAPQAVLQLLG